MGKLGHSSYSKRSSGNVVLANNNSNKNSSTAQGGKKKKKGAKPAASPKFQQQQQVHEEEEEQEQQQQQQQQKKKVSVRELMDNAIRGGDPRQQHGRNQKGKSSSKSLGNSSFSALDPFSNINNFDDDDDDEEEGSYNNNNKKKKNNFTSAALGGGGDSFSYQKPEQILQEGNDFFVERNRQEREMTASARERIERMKAVNKKGGDAHGFKFVIPKSAKKLANRMSGDVEITNAEIESSRKDHKLVPAQNTITSEEGQGDVSGLRNDDRPMRKKKPRASKNRTDFYAHDVWKKWTKNAENFLSRGRLHKRMFDSKRNFKSA